MRNTLLPFLLLILISCEDIITPELPTNDPILVVDAWLNNLNEEQKIILSSTQDYLDSTSSPSVSGAIVQVSDNLGNVFDFIESVPGEYVWQPTNLKNNLGDVGSSYILNIQHDGKEIIAQSTMNRTSIIDSVNFVRGQFPEGSYYAEFWSREEAGIGDAYWIKSYVNGIYQNGLDDIITCIDAGASSEGAVIDGIPFIPPIRRGITRFETDDDGDFISPFNKGDSIYVEIHSVTYEAFDFLNKTSIQINRPGGFGELFAVSLSNVPTNLQVVNDNRFPVVGFFNISAVHGMGNTLDEEELEKIELYNREW
tara:strand:+ start:2942 stop:3874 length:933 start_codon:yes stop_codon:yes gene_type:complete